LRMHAAGITHPESPIATRINGALAKLSRGLS
jgi:hypothetical protein